MKIHCSFKGPISKEDRARAQKINRIRDDKWLYHFTIKKHSWIVRKDNNILYYSRK